MSEEEKKKLEANDKMLGYDLRIKFDTLSDLYLKGA